MRFTKNHQSGIYLIENRITNKVYVGSALNFKRRWNCHFMRLRDGVHHSAKLQNSWNRHGKEAFSFRALLICKPEDLILYEQKVLDSFKAVDEGYNICRTAGSPLGRKASQATRDKQSAAKSGRKLTQQHRDNLSVAKTGFRHTEESRKKISEVQKGRKVSEETRAKLSAAFKGRKFSEETRLLLSKASKKKKGIPWSAARRAAFEKTVGN